MNIRPWNENDLAAILSLLNELNEALSGDQPISLEIIRSHYIEMMKSPEIYENYVAEVAGKVVGFISLVNYRSVYHRKGTTLINELVISSSYRNQGIGEALLKFSIQKAQEQSMDEIEVGVMKENCRAIAFYKRHGIDEEYLLLGKEFK